MKDKEAKCGDLYLMGKQHAVFVSFLDHTAPHPLQRVQQALFPRVLLVFQLYLQPVALPHQFLAQFLLTLR